MQKTRYVECLPLVPSPFASFDTTKVLSDAEVRKHFLRYFFLLMRGEHDPTKRSHLDFDCSTFLDSDYCGDCINEDTKEEILTMLLEVASVRKFLVLLLVTIK